MALTQLAARVDSKVKRAVELVCKDRGLKMARFVEDALVDKLEELEDLKELKALKREPTRALSDVLRSLRRDGKL